MNSTPKNKRIQNLTQFQINVSASTDSTPKQVNSKFNGKFFVLFYYLLSSMKMWTELQRNLGVTTDNAKHILKNAESQSLL